MLKIGWKQIMEQETPPSKEVAPFFHAHAPNYNGSGHPNLLSLAPSPSYWNMAGHLGLKIWGLN